mmetsp:Transcript_25277/g.84411  ORF Transcript_25277/g.84411 Transcript_25277/m.84411 type:complete len:352 (-) Transcript_25277:43-1098(-)
MGRKGRTAGANRSERSNHTSGRRQKRGSASANEDCEDFDQLVRHLAPLGLAVRKMDMDGNCLFRTFADQISGDPEEHMQLRGECCDHIHEHAEEFKVFHADDDEDEETFEHYLERMRGPGVWGSQLELTALCQKYKVNAIVHQASMPSYEMVMAALEARCIQLSYHDGEHYNSIRFASDLAWGQAPKFLSLRQIRGASSEGGEEGEIIHRVRELLPPDFAASAAELCAALASASGDVVAAAEALLGGAVGDASSDPGDTAEATGSTTGQRAADSDGDGPAKSAATAAADGVTPASRSAKRSDRKREKQVAEDRRRKARDAREAAAAVEDAGADGTPGEALLSLLTKQLVTV